MRQADATLRLGLALADPAGFGLVPLPRCARANIQPPSYACGQDGAMAVGARLTLHFTYHVESLSMCCCPSCLGRRPRSQLRWDTSLPYLPSLADVGEPCLGLPMPFRALRAKPRGLVVCTHRLVLLPPSSGATHLNFLGFARVPYP